MRTTIETIAILLIGIVIGMAIQKHDTHDRYVSALAERHESETSYWIHKLDTEIQQNSGDIARGRENNGSKKN